MTSFPAKGRFLANRAVQYFEQAIEKDSNYAIAYAGIADTLLAVDRNMGAAAAPTTFPRAKAAAEKAAELDPMLSEAQSALASVRAREYAWQDAERGFRRAIELNSNNALARLGLGASVLVEQGRFEEGLEEAGRAEALDPLSPYVNTEFGRALLMAGHFEEAVDQLRRAIALDPSRTTPYTLMGRALYLQGKTAEALTVFEDSSERGVPPGGPVWQACAEVRAGRRDRALGVLQKQLGAGMQARDLAHTYACLGDADHALEYLEISFEERDGGLAQILQAPELAWMRSNPRFAALRQKLNLAP
ncbi:MAG: tetratricopeptide repeat protein [Acidobacteria bacterium]|nr:tetratricopeptide repeat protein [Acidobacteriota bacterium]